MTGATHCEFVISYPQEELLNKKKDPMDDFCGPTVELFGIIKKKFKIRNSTQLYINLFSNQLIFCLITFCN